MTARPAVVPLGSNARQQAAAAARADELVNLRLQITETLTVLAGLAQQLEDLADSRQPVRARVVTEESLKIRAKQTELDRAAARGTVGRNPDRTLAWMNGAARIGTGQVQAPVQTMPALSVVAEIRYTLRYAIRRLGRPAKLVALEMEQTLEEDHGLCRWPRPRILTDSVMNAVDVDDQGISHLVARLALLVDVYTNRKELKALARDLDHLEEAALDVTEGMAGKSAMPSGSETCPWCGRDSLVLLSRVPGIQALVIRCDGRGKGGQVHPCECTHDFCACHSNPIRNRHEWINSGLQPDGTKVRAAANTFITLANLQNKRKELTILETKALDAIERIRALHQPIYEVDGTLAPALFPLTGDAVPVHHQCNDQCHADEELPGEVHEVDLCGTCGLVPLTTGAEPHPDELWPCPTARACDLDAHPDKPSSTDTHK